MMEELIRLDVAQLERVYKQKERAVEARVKLPFVLRLDGVGFGRVLKGFAEPRDERVHRALLQGASELVKRLSASGAYVVSDEVSVLVLGPSLPYAGRVEKLVSVSASLLSAIVSTSLARALIFDSRVVPLEGVEDAKRYIAYRARVGLNNYVGSLLHRLGAKLEHVHLAEQIEKLEKLGVRLSEKPAWEWSGSSLYWELGEKRELAVDNGPWKLLEAIEVYASSPELAAAGRRGAR
jgi:tRNA(His) 5'-end guanylyltransferase